MSRLKYCRLDYVWLHFYLCLACVGDPWKFDRWRLHLVLLGATCCPPARWCRGGVSLNSERHIFQAIWRLTGEHLVPRGYCDAELTSLSPLASSVWGRAYLFFLFKELQRLFIINMRPCTTLLFFSYISVFGARTQKPRPPCCDHIAPMTLLFFTSPCGFFLLLKLQKPPLWVGSVTWSRDH